MDRFADTMIARGPTLGPDRDSWTGSVHIVGLPSVDAAREFVAAEPYNRAGAYSEHLMRRFDDHLGRTMWDFPGGSDDPRFMVIAPELSPELATVSRERLIVRGDLLTLDEGLPAGVALALQAPSRAEVEALVGGGEEARGAEVHDWEFGGRR